jgi:hypothetical protein
MNYLGVEIKTAQAIWKACAMVELFAKNQFPGQLEHAYFESVKVNPRRDRESFITSAVPKDLVLTRIPLSFY